MRHSRLRGSVAEADIADGLADDSLATVIKGEIADLKKSDSVKEYADAIDKLKGLKNAVPFEGDNTWLSGMKNKDAKEVIQEAKNDGTEAGLLRVMDIIDTITAKTRQNLCIS